MASRERDDDDSEFCASKRIKTDVATVATVPDSLRAGIANVLAWATHVDEWEHNEKAEVKVHAVWNLTRHLDSDERLKVLNDLRNGYEAACKEDDGRWKKRKRLMWAVKWIDEMLENVRTEEPFDETLCYADRY